MTDLTLAVPVEGLLTADAFNVGRLGLSNASSDAGAINSWLANYKDSPHTFSSYRREAERLMLYCAWRRVSLQQLTVEHMQAFRAWLQDPQPIERWCLQTKPRYLPDGSINPEWKSVQREKRLLTDGSGNPNWKPFVSALQPSAAQQVMTVVFGLFEYLCAIGWLGANPCRALRVKRARNDRPIERYLEHDTWQIVENWLAAQEDNSSRLNEHAERNRFVLGFLYLTGLRRAELAKVQTTDFVLRRCKWWLVVVGKGNVLSEVPINTSAQETVNRYLQSTGRSELPAKPGPLLLSIGGKSGVSEAGLYTIVRQALGAAADDASDPAVAQTLRRASVHWLRHTSASHALDAGASLGTVQRTLRHSNISTTSRYLHKDRDVQHDELDLLRRPGQD